MSKRPINDDRLTTAGKQKLHTTSEGGGEVSIWNDLDSSSYIVENTENSRAYLLAKISRVLYLSLQ